MSLVLILEDYPARAEILQEILGEVATVRVFDRVEDLKLFLANNKQRHTLLLDYDLSGSERLNTGKTFTEACIENPALLRNCRKVFIHSMDPEGSRAMYVDIVSVGVDVASVPFNVLIISLGSHKVQLLNMLAGD